MKCSGRHLWRTCFPGATGINRDVCDISIEIAEGSVPFRKIVFWRLFGMQGLAALRKREEGRSMAKPLELTGDDARRFHRYMETYEELPPRGRKLMADAVRLARQEPL